MPDTKQESPMAVVTAVPVMEMTRENVPAPGTAQWKNGVCGCCDHKGTNGEEAIEFLLKSTVVLTIFFYIFSFAPVLFVVLKKLFYSFLFRIVSCIVPFTTVVTSVLHHTYFHHLTRTTIHYNV